MLVKTVLRLVVTVLKYGRWNKEFDSWDKSELKFEDNFTCLSWLLDFISSRQKTNDKFKSFQSKKRLHKWLFQVRLRLYERKEGCKYCYYYYLYYCCQCKYSYYRTVPKYIPPENQRDIEQRKRKQTEKQEDFISYRWKSRYLFIR